MHRLRGAIGQVQLLPWPTAAGLADTKAATADDPPRGDTAAETYKSRTIAAFTTSAMLPRLQDLHDQNRCLIFLATNHPKKVDSAIKRAGRFDFTVTVDHPKIDRLCQYLAKLNKKTLKLTDLEGMDPALTDNLLNAVREVLEDRSEKDDNSLKFAIIEEVLRQVRPIDGKSKEDLKTAAVEVLERQLQATERGNPPELAEL